MTLTSWKHPARARRTWGSFPRSPAEVTDPGWEAVMDVDSVAAKRVRAEVIRAIADGPDVIGAAHFPFGHMITVDGGHQFRFLDLKA